MRDRPRTARTRGRKHANALLAAIACPLQVDPSDCDGETSRVGTRRIEIARPDRLPAYEFHPHDPLRSEWRHFGVNCPACLAPSNAGRKRHSIDEQSHTLLDASSSDVCNVTAEAVRSA